MSAQPITTKSIKDMDVPFENSIINEVLGDMLTADPTLTPGHGSCAICAAPATTTCASCNAVSYCGKACMAADRVNWDAPLPEPDDDEDLDDDLPPPPLGHTSQICDILTDVVASDLAEQNDTPNAAVTSELESFPATLSNFLLSHPSYETLAQQGGLPGKQRTLQIHIIGATPDSETPTDFAATYGDALDDVCSTFQVDIELVFVGPGLAAIGVEGTNKAVKVAPQIRAFLLPVSYENLDTEDDNLVRHPDLAVFFNPGFTCLDYDWIAGLSSIKEGTPFLAATNTMMEGLNDCDWLHANGFVAKSVEEVEEEDDVPAFIGPNPWAGERIRQSGVFANDLYVKNSTVFGGLLVGGGKQTKGKGKRGKSEEKGGAEGKKKAKKNKGLI